MSETNPKLKTSRWLAERLGISLTSVETLRKKQPDQLPPALTFGRSIRYDEQTVETWLKERMQSGNALPVVDTLDRLEVAHG